MAIGRDFPRLMEDIGYTFRDFTYLERALTHSSFTYEMRSKGIRAESNERLEFLGDAVLGLIISEELYGKYGSEDEGRLTRIRQSLVCESMLAKIARKISLGDYLNVGKGEESSNIRDRDKVLADALEALIAAVYLDSKDSDAAAPRKVILTLFKDEIAHASKKVHSDYKTELQKLVEKNGDAVLCYELCAEDGPEHDRCFTVRALVNNNEVGIGHGKTKKAAEMQAAHAALLLFGVNCDDEEA